MPQSQVLKAKGLYTFPNDWSEIPEGGLVTADNVEIKREGVIEPRRGFGQLTNNLPAPGDRASQLFGFKDVLLTHYGTKIARYDSMSGWVDYSGSFSNPDNTLCRMQGVEANNNFYLTTTKGIVKLDSPTGSIINAGVPQGLDSSASVVQKAGSFFIKNNQIAYRTVWAIKDANNNLVMSAPSDRLVVVNPNIGGADSFVTIVETIPAGITTNHFLQVYRTDLSGSDTTAPNENYQLVQELYPTSTDITNKYLTFDDDAPDEFKGAYLYTSETQEGILQENLEPPLCKTLDVYKGYLFFGNTTQKYRYTVTILGVATSFAVTINSVDSTTQVTLADASDILIGYFLNQGSTYIKVIDVNYGTNQITLDTAHTWTAGAATVYSGGLRLNDTITIAGVTYTAKAVENIAAAEFAITTAGTPSENIDSAARSLIRVINRYTGNTLVYAYYLSGPNDLPGKIFLQSREFGASVFTVGSTNGEAFRPDISGTESADNQVEQHALYYSKFQQPEAVPLLNVLYIGSANYPIWKIVALRDAIIILKPDAVYRLTGFESTSFRIDVLDSTTNILSPDTAIKLNNQVYALTTQGVVAITDTGVTIKSRPIEDKFLAIFGINDASLRRNSFAVAYEADRKYILYTINNPLDTYATQAFVYNFFTNAWTRWTGSRTCGVLFLADQKLYLGNALSNRVVQERKTFSYRDYIDEGYSVNIETQTSDLTVIVESLENIVVGDLLYESTTKFAIVTAINVSTRELTLSNAITWLTPTVYTIVSQTDLTNVVVSDVTGLSLGEFFSQTQYEYFVITNIDSMTNTITLDGDHTWILGDVNVYPALTASTIYKTINCIVEWAPHFSGNIYLNKHYREILLLFKESFFNLANIGFTSNISTALERVEIVGQNFGIWGQFPWGSVPWGGTATAKLIRTYVPRDKRRCAWIKVRFEYNRGFGKFLLDGISYTFNPMSEKVTR